MQNVKVVLWYMSVVMLFISNLFLFSKFKFSSTNFLLIMILVLVWLVIIIDLSLDYGEIIIDRSLFKLVL